MRVPMVGKKNKITLADRMFGNVDLIGAMASLAVRLANLDNQNPFMRGMMEKFLEIHKDRLLPTIHSKTFSK
jgi:hypothetical protein